MASKYHVHPIEKHFQERQARRWDPERCSYCGQPAGSADCQRLHP